MTTQYTVSRLSRRTAY